MKSPIISILSCFILSIGAMLILPSCNTCKGKEPYEAFDFRLIDSNGNNLVGENLTYSPYEVFLNSGGNELINGFYIQPQLGVIFILDYSPLSNGENMGVLQAGLVDDMPIQVSINQKTDDCFQYNQVNDFLVDGNSYPISQIIDIIK